MAKIDVVYLKIINSPPINDFQRDRLHFLIEMKFQTPLLILFLTLAIPRLASAGNSIHSIALCIRLV